MDDPSDEAVTLLDDSAFPIARLYPGRVTTLARFRRLSAEWARMVARDGPFAIISFGDHPDDEPREVAHERALFFKRNRDVFRDRCAVIVNVEPDPDERLAREREAAKVVQALGFRLAVVASEGEALSLAHARLLQGQPSRPHARGRT